MSVNISLPDELAAEIDRRASDRTRFVVEAVRRLLHDDAAELDRQEIQTINEHADELNAEAADALEYQALA